MSLPAIYSMATSSSTTTTDDIWTCSECECENDADVTACEGCEAPRTTKNKQEDETATKHQKFVGLLILIELKKSVKKLILLFIF